MVTFYVNKNLYSKDYVNLQYLLYLKSQEQQACFIFFLNFNLCKFYQYLASIHWYYKHRFVEILVYLSLFTFFKIVFIVAASQFTVEGENNSEYM